MLARFSPMPTSDQSNAIHDHLSAALLVLADAVATNKCIDLMELLEVARLLTEAQQKLHVISKAMRAAAPPRVRCPVAANILKTPL
jgi:hypothetical protein